MSIADAGETYSLQKVELLKFGGNDRFKQFLDSFKNEDENSEHFGESIFKGWPIRDKYSTNACKYYRHKIQSLARQETPKLDCPDNLNEAKTIMDEDIEGKWDLGIILQIGFLWQMKKNYQQKMFRRKRSFKRVVSKNSCMKQKAS